MAELNKHNIKIFVRKQKELKNDTIEAKGSAAYEDCTQMLNECRDMYDRLESWRANALRCYNYTFGRQWEDRIINPDGTFWKETIKEEDYIKNQGKVPLKYNVMGKSLKTVVGLYRQNRAEPVAIAHDRDEQKLGEMMTIVLQYAYNTNRIFELNVNLLKIAYCTGLAIRSCYYRPDDERQMSDVYVQNENPFMMFFNSDIQDPLMRDLETIGAIRDMSREQLIQRFATSESDARKLMEEYKGVIREQVETLDAFDVDRYGTESDFFVPKDVNKCRVFEIWRKEWEACYYCHDTAAATVEYRPISDRKEIEAENKRRQDQMVALGYSPEDASLIEYGSGKNPNDHKIYYRSYWHYYYLTPLGHCILDGESEFEHGSHPFTLAGFPMINGEIHSPAEELIDIQRVINRTMSQIDFIRQNSAKGVLMCPVDAVPDWMTPEEFASSYTKNGGVLFYKPNPNGKVPEQVKSNSVVAGDIEMINLYKTLNDEISGVNSALRGETPSSATPASRYAQEAQNSATNLADFMGWFNDVINRADYKLMALIQQYYDDKRYIPIAGKNYSEEAKWYDPEKIRQSRFDLTINEATSTPAYRMALEDTLFQAMQMGALDFKSYLEASSAPFADKLLEIIKRNEKQAAEAQAQAQQAQMMQAAQGQQPIAQ